MPTRFALYQRHRLAVFRYLRTRTASEDDAAELTAITFERALTAMRAFEGSHLSRPLRGATVVPGSGTARPHGRPVEPSGSGDADVVWTAPEVGRVGALVDRRGAGRAPTTHVPVHRHRARLARPGQRRDAARNGCELERDPADRIPRPPGVQPISATIGSRRGPRRRGQVERDVSVGRGPGVGSRR